MTKTPKLLPWIARKAGISDEQNTTLWSKAMRRAALQNDTCPNSDHSRSAMQHLHELLERERAAA
jgi:hypothetical protein